MGEKEIIEQIEKQFMKIKKPKDILVKESGKVIKEFKILNSIQKQSESILENLGIKVQVKYLESNKEYQILYNKVYGYGLFYSFYCRYIRPILFKEKHEQLQNEFHKIEIKYKNEFLNKILEEGDKCTKMKN